MIIRYLYLNLIIFNKLKNELIISNKKIKNIKYIPKLNIFSFK